ncbi:uncharacterized protein TNIN_150051 [Trichonephila inaurata madagascariensis]|uniref:Uncharacterized protein n=1 Tax=Trichonephila inaurata madagascariensis TaxID=2747483 RepID=A0A8X6Y857_9ARAC|nr:uncharacterized protein TNIN_150051 [Trichonephila inaurata madagascariensis]
MSKESIFQRHKAFKEGRQNVEDIEQKGRHSTSITETMIITAPIIIIEDHRITVRQLHVLLNISVGRVHSIMAEYLQLEMNITPTLWTS